MAMEVAIRRQHFGQAVKAAARRDERNDTVNNLVTIQSEREGDEPMTWTITKDDSSRTTRTMVASGVVATTTMMIAKVVVKRTMTAGVATNTTTQQQ